MANSEEEYHYGYNGTGSVSELTDMLGKVQEAYTYDAFGNSTVMEANASTGNPYTMSSIRTQRLIINT